MSNSGVSNGQATDVPLLARGMTFEQMTVGSAFRTAARTVTEPDLMSFITLCGFTEPLFVDARHAAGANYTGRLIPGALTFCLGEGSYSRPTRSTGPVWRSCTWSSTSGRLCTSATPSMWLWKSLTGGRRADLAAVS